MLSIHQSTLSLNDASDSQSLPDFVFYKSTLLSFESWPSAALTALFFSALCPSWSSCFVETVVERCWFDFTSIFLGCKSVALLNVTAFHRELYLQAHLSFGTSVVSLAFFPRRSLCATKQWIHMTFSSVQHSIVNRVQQKTINTITPWFQPLFSW